MEGTDPGHAGIEPTKNGIAAERIEPFGILRERNRVRSIVMFSPDSARALPKPRHHLAMAGMRPHERADTAGAGRSD